MSIINGCLTEIRTTICHRFLLAAAILSVPAASLSCYRAVVIGWQPVMTFFFVLPVFILAVTALRRRLPLAVKSGFIILLMMTVGIGGMLQFGLLAAGVLFLVSAPLLAALLFGGREGALVLVATLVAMTAIAGQVLSTGGAPRFDLAAYMTSPISWAHQIGSVAFIAGAMAFMFQGYSEALVSALADARSNEDRLREALIKRQAAEADAKQTQKAALVALADLAEHRDSDTGEHVLRVARMTHEIARTLLRKGVESDHCTEQFLEHIGISSILHDVGKVSVPDAVLLKPGRLTSEERAVMERHAHAGGEILGKAARMMPDSQHFKLAGEVASSHHEHWDGSGYPRNLRGREIPLAARIVAVSDVFDALTSRRPYKDPWPEDKAIAFVEERRGTQFDPAVVDAFHDVLAMRARASVVEWNEQIAIDHPIVDHDHRILLQLINQIGNRENADDPTAVRFVLDELVNYTHFHFTREEQLLAEAGYPDLDTHRRIHADMIADVEELRHRFGVQGAEIGDELSQYLTMWLVNHIMYEDRMYGPYVTK